MSYTPVEVIEVRAFGNLVGAIAPDPDSRTYLFEYDEGWLERNIELSPLHLPARPGVYHFPGLNPDTFRGLPPAFADSLPDRFGNSLIDAWMARQGIDPARITTLDRLAYMGERGMGALTYHPPIGTDAGEITAVQLADLVTAARRAVRGEIGVRDDNTADALTNLIRVGTSAGGARPKAVIAFNPDTGQIRSGQTTAPEGYSHWLCKLDGVEATNVGPDTTLGNGQPFGRIEYAYHLMAAAAGIEMTPCRLLTEFDRAHFMTRRFDRTDDGGRLHVLSLCGLAHLDFNQPRVHDYAQYLQTIDLLGLGPDALEQAFTRIVFNIAAVNCDDHTKNLAFLMDPDGTWSLAPAYDVTYAYNPAGQWANAHQMSVEGSFQHVTVNDLRRLADRFAVPSPDHTIGRVVDAVATWPQHAEAAELPGPTTQEIGEAHRLVGLGAG